MDHFCCFSLGEIFQKSTITSTTGLGDINSPTLLGKVSAEKANLSYIVRRSITTYMSDFLFDWIIFNPKTELVTRYPKLATVVVANECWNYSVKYYFLIVAAAWTVRPVL